jgi:hypothetical protein
MNNKQPDDSEDHGPVRGEAASSELWLDEALAETFPASDPIPWRHEVAPAKSEAAHPEHGLSDSQSITSVTHESARS